MDEGILNELLECSVCLERLDSSSKVLPCQHTFCKRCLEEIFTSRKELRCPECRILVETKINDLPNNFLLIRLLEGIKYAPRAANKLENGNDSILLTSSHERPSNPETSSPSNNKPSLSIEPDKSVDKVTSKKQTVQPHPCAKALYTYEAKEPGDLSFKKGDIIMLKKKIDQNWYHGEHGSKHGFFPINYVQVITPLPSQLPQAKALFDFSYHESDEKDCLSFKKGDILTVIRRVDENWVEGKLKEKIGIFPISFVEMNGVAKAVVKLSSNITAGPIREVPPAPQKQNVVLSPTSSHTIATSTQSESCSINPPKLNASISSDQQFAQKSSKNETPRKTSCSQNVTNQSSAEAGITSTIPQPLPQPPCHPKVNFHRRDKRHSVSVSSITTPVSSKNVTRSSEHGYRHSIDVSHMAPITIPSHIARPRGATHPIVESSQSNSTVTSSSSIPTSTNTTLTDTSGCQLVRRHSSNRRERNNTVNHSRQHSAPDPSSLAASSHAVHSQVPAFYVAMYSYKPQKEDELELKKNELYTVSEKCLDGWFKGTSLRTAQTGVFPGNYVQVAKPSILQANFQQIMSSNVALKVSSNGSMNAQNSNKPSSKEKHHGNANQRTNASGHDANSRSGSNHSRSKNSVASPPPRPPRPQASMEGSASPWVAKSNSSVNSLQSQKMTVALPPYGNNVSKASINSTMVSSNPTVVNSLPQGQTVCSTTSSQSWHGVIPSTSRPQAASLLTSASTITPPNVSVNSSPSNIAQAKVVKEKKEGMSTVFKRLTGVKKKSKSPPPNNISMDNPNFIDSSKPVTPIHIRSGSCPSENLASTSQKKSNETDKNVTPQRPKQPAPLIRERFRCIVPYPPNCDYELELKVGDIIYVHKKRDDGWYKGTLQRTGITGLFPGSFVEKF